MDLLSSIENGFNDIYYMTGNWTKLQFLIFFIYILVFFCFHYGLHHNFIVFHHNP